MKPKFALAAWLLSLGTGLAVTGTELDIGTGNTVPSGSKSIAAGSGNNVVNGSFAFGDTNTADNGSFAHGLSNGNLGYSSVVFGEGNTIDSASYVSMALGEYNLMIGSEASFAVGTANTVTKEQWSFVAGSSNSIYSSVNQGGGMNILMGMNNVLDKAAPPVGIVSGTVLLGSFNSATSSRAYALGEGLQAQTEAVALGGYNQPVPNASLIVGTGTDIARSNGLVVLKDGTVNIPSGNLVLGSESALTATSAAPVISSHLSSNGYLKKVNGAGASGSSSHLVIGDDAVASNSMGIAIGNSALSSNTGSYAFGKDSISSGAYAVALGFEAEAVGDYSLAAGAYASAQGASSIALGSGSYAAGDESFAVLGGNAATNSIAIMYGSASGEFALATNLGISTADSSIALGGYDYLKGSSANWSSGENAASIGGVGNRSRGFASFSSGNWSYAKTAYSVALGSLNKGEGSSWTDWVQTDPLFELGNGYAARSTNAPSDSNRSNAITTLKNGQTKLTNKFWNSSTPTEIPSNATEASDGEALVVEGHTRLKGKVVMEQAQGDISMGVYGD